MSHWLAHVLDRLPGSMVLDRRAMILQMLLRVVRRILQVCRRVGRLGDRRCRLGRNIDLDISDRVSFDMVRIEAMSRIREENSYVLAKTLHARRKDCPPFCSVSVAVCELTAATVPCTTVFGGFCSVTATEMPMRLDAMLAGRQPAVRREC